MREAIFDVLMHHPTHACDLSGDARVLDLFAGSGGLGIEALSRGGGQGRGGAEAHFVERDRGALQALRRNLENLGLEGRTTVWPMEARRAVERLADAGEQFDLVLVDPPYAMTETEAEATARILDSLAAADLLAPAAVLVLERAARNNDDVPDVVGLGKPLVRRWGDTEALFYRNG